MITIRLFICNLKVHLLQLSFCIYNLYYFMVHSLLKLDTYLLF